MKKQTRNAIICLWLAALLMAACVPTSKDQIKSLSAKVAEALPAEWPEGIVQESIVRQQPDPEQMAQDQVLKVGVSRLAGLDPVVNYSTSSMLQEVLYIGLTRQYPDTLAFLPAVAEKWEVSEDQLTWTFTLRTKIAWVAYNAKTQKVEKVLDKDGKEIYVTAEDVRANLMRVLNRTGSAFLRELLLNIKGVEAYSAKSPEESLGVKAVDEKTLEITLEKPIPALDAIAELAFFSPYPGRIDDLRRAKGLMNNDVAFFGFGPFVVKSFTENKSAVVVRNPFWQASDAVPTPLLEEIRFLVVASKDKLTSFNKGTIDIVQLTQSEYTTHEASLKTQDTLQFVDGICPVFIAFKHLEIKPFSDADNRKALAYSINRTEIVNDLYKKAASELGYFSLPGIRAGNDFGIFSAISFDTSKAKGLLKSDMWSEKSTDAPTFYISPFEPLKSIGWIILEDAKAALNRTLKANYPTSSNYTATINATKLPSIYISSVCLRYGDMEDIWDQLFWDNELTSQSVRDFHQQVLENPSPDDRAAVYLQVNDALIDKTAVIIPLVNPMQIWLVSRDVRGDLLPRYQQFETWWIAKE